MKTLFILHLQNVINYCQDFFLDEDEDFNLEEIEVDILYGCEYPHFDKSKLSITSNIYNVICFLILHNNNGVLNLA